MKTNFWRALFLSSVLTVSVSRSNTVATSTPQFSISNATSFPVTVEASRIVLPNNGILPAGQTWQLSLVSTGDRTSSRGGNPTTKYYHLDSIKATIPASGNTPALVGERKKDWNNTKEREGGMTSNGPKDFYIVRPGPSAPNLQIIKLVS